MTQGPVPGDALPGAMPPTPVRLLMVCTANRCRSPLAEAAARRWLAARPVPVVVASAGVAAAAGIPATPTTVTAGRGLGLDLTGHRSRPAEPEVIRWADVVIGMESAHVLELASRAPECQPWIATLPELAHAARTDPLAAPRPGVDGATLREWVAQHHAPLGDLLGGRLDIGDPVGRPAADHERAAARIIADLDQVLSSWFGPSAATAAAATADATGTEARGRRWRRGRGR